MCQEGGWDRDSVGPTENREHTGGREGERSVHREHGGGEKERVPCNECLRTYRCTNKPIHTQIHNLLMTWHVTY